MLFTSTGVKGMEKEQIDKLCENKPAYIKVTAGELSRLQRYASSYLDVKETLAGSVYSYRSIQLFLV